MIGCARAVSCMCWYCLAPVSCMCWYAWRHCYTSTAPGSALIRTATHILVPASPAVRRELQLQQRRVHKRRVHHCTSCRRPVCLLFSSCVHLLAWLDWRGLPNSRWAHGASVAQHALAATWLPPLYNGDCSAGVTAGARAFDSHVCGRTWGAGG